MSAFWRRGGVGRWSREGLTHTRLKRLAQVARRASGQALQRMPEERRYPTLVAFLHQSLSDVTDETIDLFDRCLAEAYARAGHDLEEFHHAAADTINETARLFGELARVVLDPSVRDAHLRVAIYRKVPQETLRKAVEDSARVVRPADDNGFDFLSKQYGHLRRFIPTFLSTFVFRSNTDPDPLLEAVDLLRRLRDRRGRTLPPTPPRGVLPGQRDRLLGRGKGGGAPAHFALCAPSGPCAGPRA